MLASRQQSVANLLRRVAEVEARLKDARRAAEPAASPAPPAPRFYGLVRTTVLDIVFEAPEGIASVDVGRRLRERLVDGVAVKTHHTTLARLEADGLVRRMEGRWLLTPEGCEAALASRTW